MNKCWKNRRNLPVDARTSARTFRTFDVGYPRVPGEDHRKIWSNFHRGGLGFQTRGIHPLSLVNDHSQQ